MRSRWYHSVSTGEITIAAYSEEKVNWSATQLVKVRRRRALGGFGGLLLFSAFFMPAIPVCSSPIIPAEEFWEIVSDDSVSFAGLAGGFLLFGAAYLFGLLMLITVLRGRTHRTSAEKSLGISISVLFGIVAAMLSIGVFLEILMNPSGWELEGAIFAFIVLVSFAYWSRSIRLGTSGLLSMRWYAALCCTSWFGHIFIGSSIDGTKTYYGLWFSLAGSVCVLIGIATEARLRCRKRLSSTVWDLIRCRIRLYDLDGPRCFGCGYLLVGLPSNRCPECGQSFNRDDYGSELDAQTTGTAQDGVIKKAPASAGAGTLSKVE